MEKQTLIPLKSKVKLHKNQNQSVSLDLKWKGVGGGGWGGVRGSQFSKYMYFVLKRNLGLNKMEWQTPMPAKVMNEATQESKCAIFPPFILWKGDSV